MIISMEKQLVSWLEVFKIVSESEGKDEIRSWVEIR